MFAIVSAIVIQAVLTTAASAQTAASATPATAENAAAFLGDWTISGSGPNGSVTFALTIKADAGKVVGEISGEVMARQTITDISKSPTSLLLAFSFDYQGNPVGVALTLTPADGKVGVNMDFASGAYVVVGGATKAVPKQ
jgi:hypothetical protein